VTSPNFRPHQSKYAVILGIGLVLAAASVVIGYAGLKIESYQRALDAQLAKNRQASVAAATLASVNERREQALYELYAGADATQRAVTRDRYQPLSKSC
jgi:hypothetical protein